MKNKLFIIPLILFLALIISFPVIAAPQSQMSDAGNGTSINNGSEETAIKKLNYMALRDCINNSNAWKSNLNDRIKAKNLLSGNWFSNGGTFSKSGGSYIVNEVMGSVSSTSEGLVNCGYKNKDNNTTFLSKTLGALGLNDSKGIIICNYSDPTLGGVLEEKDGNDCRSALNNGGKFELNNTRSYYFKTLIKNKVFGGHVPGDNLDTLTNLEKYYVYLNTFTTACASGTAKFGSPADYQILQWNPNQKEWQSTGYAKQERDGVVYTYNGESWNCEKLANELNKTDSAIVVAYKTEQEKKMAADPNYTPKTATGKTTNSSSQNGSKDDDEDGEEIEPDCSNSGGAMSLGWILCPALNLMGDASEDIYNKFVEPSLQIEPQLFSQNPDQGTQKAWSAFQTIANTCFTILLLFVIFSQLTGVGIDNYGIKKILPKLIITAVLVNLSYLICIVCVDLSNIVGNGIQSLFDSLSTGGDPTLTIPEATFGDKVGSVAITGLTGVSILAALVGMGGAIWANPAVVLSLLVSALGVIISIFFLFILLSAREAAVVVLTVISPIAFVCYVLPNTKKIFDKWVKFGEGLLLVYPICSLLVGGGDYVSRLLLSSGFAATGFAAALTAMVVGILPIFFVPTVLKNSFSALGNIGAKISSFGDRVRSGTTGKIRGTEGYKNAQKLGLDRKTRVLKAGVNKDGEDNFIGKRRNAFAKTKLGKLTGATARQAANITAAEKIRVEQKAAMDTLVGREYVGKVMPQIVSEFEEAYKNGDGEKVEALSNLLVSRYGAGGVKQIASVIRDPEINHIGNANAAKSLKVLQDSMSRNTNFSNLMSAKDSAVYSMISDGGIIRYTNKKGEKVTELQNVETFDKNNTIPTDAKAWSTHSGDALIAAIKAGTLKDDMVNSMLDSNDPVIQSGLQTDPSKRDVLQAEMYAAEHQIKDYDLANKAQREEFAKRYRQEQLDKQNAAIQAREKQDAVQQQQLDELKKLNEKLQQKGTGEFSDGAGI